MVVSRDPNKLRLLDRVNLLFPLLSSIHLSTVHIALNFHRSTAAMTPILKSVVVTSDSIIKNYTKPGDIGESKITEAFKNLVLSIENPTSEQFQYLKALAFGISKDTRRFSAEMEFAISILQKEPLPLENELNRLLEGESVGLQKAVRSILKESNSLTEMCMMLWDIRLAFKQTRNARSLTKIIEHCAMKDENSPYPDWEKPKSVEWVYATVDEQGVVSDETFTLAIDLVDSPLTAEFISVMTGQNNYGESGAAISLVDAISKASGGNVAAHIILDLPSDSPLMLKSKETVDEYTVSRKAGDILFSVCNHQNTQMLAIQFPGSSRTDFVKVGEFNLAESVPVEDRIKQTVIKILNTTVHYHEFKSYGQNEEDEDFKPTVFIPRNK
ncbi:hypothetical protein WR25_21300 [Diploscapter pachys]|uniref:Uncharacterized protein n=1 Tax=Diploscapter pachys TaxID=2018661 RepID=A0A2A2KVT3_9BILA|nr:hypothetical protein WR25_21300 [Diploscapter pachys]